MTTGKRFAGIIAAMILGAILAFAFLPQTYGNLEARFDLAVGKPRYLIYGELLPEDSLLCHTMRTEYRVIPERVAGCEIDYPWLLRYWDAYNRVIDDHLELPNGQTLIAVILINLRGGDVRQP